MITLLWLIIIIVVAIILYQNYEPEDIIIENYLNTFTGRLAVDDQYFYDKLFDDVYYYPNEEDGTTGWVRCRSECPGHCVEYGVHGVSYCFPY